MKAEATPVTYLMLENVTVTEEHKGGNFNGLQFDLYLSCLFIFFQTWTEPHLTLSKY